MEILHLSLAKPITVLIDSCLLHVAVRFQGRLGYKQAQTNLHGAARAPMRSPNSPRHIAPSFLASFLSFLSQMALASSSGAGRIMSLAWTIPRELFRRQCRFDPQHAM